MVFSTFNLPTFGNAFGMETNKPEESQPPKIIHSEIKELEVIEEKWVQPQRLQPTTTNYPMVSMKDLGTSFSQYFTTMGTKCTMGNWINAPNDKSSKSKRKKNQKHNIVTVSSGAEDKKDCSDFSAITELRRNTSAPVKVHEVMEQDEIEVEALGQAVVPKADKQLSFNDKDAANHLKKELAGYLKKEKKKGKTKKSQKEKRHDLKRLLKRSLKAYLVAQESHDPERVKNLELAVGKLVKNACGEFDQKEKSKKPKKKEGKHQKGDKSKKRLKETKSGDKMSKLDHKEEADQEYPAGETSKNDQQMAPPVVKTSFEKEEREDDNTLTKDMDKSQVHHFALKYGPEDDSGVEEEAEMRELASIEESLANYRQLPVMQSRSQELNLTTWAPGAHRSMSALGSFIQSEFQRLEEIASGLDSLPSPSQESAEVTPELPPAQSGIISKQTCDSAIDVYAGGSGYTASWEATDLDENLERDLYASTSLRESYSSAIQSKSSMEERIEWAKHALASLDESCEPNNDCTVRVGEQRSTKRLNEPMVSRTPKTNDISAKHKELEAEIAAELARLQSLQEDFMTKVSMASFRRSSMLASDIFSQNAYKGILKTKEKAQEELAMHEELNCLREAQSSLFGRGKQRTERE